jgi:phospholipid/cholesterol/gamma-HCH transport system substrate-binding protein
VPHGSAASIVPNGFFGDVAIALQPEGPNPTAYAEGDTVPAKPGAAGLQVIASRADSALQVTQRILGSTQRELVDSGGLRELRLLMGALSRTATTLERVVDAQSHQFELTMGTVRSRAAAVDSARVDSTVRSIHTATENFVSVTNDLKVTTAKLNTLIAKVDSGNGNAAKLLNDDTLYRNMLSTVARFDSLLADIKKNPRRYINLTIF